jgi:hypothetical protein
MYIYSDERLLFAAVHLVIGFMRSPVCLLALLATVASKPPHKRNSYWYCSRRATLFPPTGMISFDKSSSLIPPLFTSFVRKDGQCDAIFVGFFTSGVVSFGGTQMAWSLQPVQHC